MFNLQFLAQIRDVELDALAAMIPAGSRVLDFGAGTGEQARILTEKGFDVVAIDLGDSSLARDRVYPVTDYDGRTIPLPDASVDVIFSSNVLEHVEDLPPAFREFRRVLKPGGVEIHAMPTPAWRFWTFVAGVPTALQAAALMLPHALRPPAGASRKQALLRDFKNVAGGLLPIAHGTAREGISELWTFSPKAWAKMFKDNEHEILEQRPIGIFYTGHMLLGSRLSFAARRKLSSTIGSAAVIYVVRPTA
jgi:SAM-dependent methyltransferase